jgi:mycobactin peptide synthetase MbtE
MHRPGNRLAPGLRPALRPHHATGPAVPDLTDTGWHTAFATRLRGALDTAALGAALDAVAARQDALRYRIVDGTGVVDRPGPVPLPVLDLTDLPLWQRPGVLDTHLAGLARTPFDPADRLWRAAVYRLDADDHILAFAGHRAIFDDRAEALLAAELAGAYPLGAAAGPPPRTTFGEYLAWRAAGRGRDDLRWWSAHLDGVAARLDLPTDAASGTDAAGEAGLTGAAGAEPPAPGGFATTVLDPPASAGVRGLARSLDATPAAVLLAALGIVLARLAGQADFVVGTPMAGPRSPAFEPLLGGLAGITALRLRPDLASSFASQVQRARDELLEALAHATVELAEVTGALRVPGRLVQVLFETVDVEPPALALAGLTAQPVPVPTPTPVELTIRCVPHGNRLRLEAAYDTDRYRPERIAALLATLAQVVTQAADAPDRLGEEFALRPEAQPAPERDRTVLDRLGRRAAVGELGEIAARWAGGWLGTGRTGRYRPDGTVEPAGPVRPPVVVSPAPRPAAVRHPSRPTGAASA